mgnify:CR=1 FL=1
MFFAEVHVSPEETEFVDRFGLFMEMLGGPRTMGRVYGRLLICDPPQQSLTELAQTLSVSKASVSTVARQLQQAGMIERLPSSSRQHLYRVTPGGFASVLGTQLSLMKFGIDAADFGLSLLDKKHQRTTRAPRGLPRLLRVLRTGLPRRVDAAVARLPRQKEAIVSTRTDKVDFSGVKWGSVEWTNLVTLYLRAYESRSAKPILADHAAAEAVERIDYDFKRMQPGRPTGVQPIPRCPAGQNSSTTGPPTS